MTIFNAVLVAFAVIAGTLCAEIPKTTLSPVFIPQEPLLRAVEPVRDPVRRAEDDSKPFVVDLLGQNGLSNPERIKHQTGQAAVGAVAGYGAQPAQEVAYPDVAYAPGYGYDAGYGKQQAYDRYGNAVGYYEDPEPYSPPTALGLLWSTMPDAKGIAIGVGRAIGWVLSGAFVVVLGAALTFAVCALSGLCAVNIQGLTVTEQMRSLVTDERLQQLGTAAGILHKALNKYNQPKPMVRR